MTEQAQVCIALYYYTLLHFASFIVKENLLYVLQKIFHSVFPISYLHCNRLSSVTAFNVLLVALLINKQA